MTDPAAPDPAIVERLLKVESDPIGAGLAHNWYRNPDGPEAAQCIEILVAALEKCRAKFAEYVEMHKAKLHDGTPSAEYIDVRRKAARNQEMVEMCDRTLAKVRGR